MLYIVRNGVVANIFEGMIMHNLVGNIDHLTADGRVASIHVTDSVSSRPSSGPN